MISHLIAIGQQEFQGGRHVLEGHGHFRLGRRTRTGAEFAAPDLHDAADAAVLKADPCDDVALLQPFRERRDAGGCEVQHLGQGDKDGPENLPVHSRSYG